MNHVKVISVAILVFCVIKTGHAKSQSIDDSYNEAVQAYFSFQNELAIQKLNDAISLYNKHPGETGHLIRAWMLRAQLAYELSEKLELEEAVSQLVSLMPQPHTYDWSLIAPEIKKRVSLGFARCEADNQLVEIIPLATSKTDRHKQLYVNGVKFERSPNLKIKLAGDRVMISDNGTRVKLYVLSNKTKALVETHLHRWKMMGVSDEHLAKLKNPKLESSTSPHVETFHTKSRSVLTRPWFWTAATVVGGGTLAAILAMQGENAQTRTLNITIAGPLPNPD